MYGNAMTPERVTKLSWDATVSISIMNLSYLRAKLTLRNTSCYQKRGFDEMTKAHECTNLKIV